MGEEEAKPLTYIPEIILKKRKSNEEQALRRKAQLEQRKFANRKNKQEYIKKPEEFVKEFRYRVMFGITSGFLIFVSYFSFMLPFYMHYNA